MEGNGKMKLLWLIIFCFSAFAQLPGGIRSPATMGQFNGFTAAEIMALGPTVWITGDLGVIPGTDGSRTTEWQDQSGNDYHLRRTNLVQLQPYWNDAVINGHGAMRFYGTNIMDLTNRFAATLEVPLEFFFVGCGTNSFPYGSGFAYSGVDNNPDSFQLALSPSQIQFRDQGATVGIGRNYTTNKWVVAHSYARTNVAFIRTFDRTYGFNRVAITFGMRGFRLGYDSQSGTYWYTGWIAELIFFNKALNEHQAQGVSKYLCKKYNLPINK